MPGPTDAADLRPAGLPSVSVTVPIAGGVVTYLPAPYETPQQDDLAATLAAVLTTTVAALSAWVLGSSAYTTIRLLGGRVHRQRSAGSHDQAQIESAVVAAGWAVATLFLGIGALLVLFRRGRKAAVLRRVDRRRDHRAGPVRRSATATPVRRCRSRTGRCTGVGVAVVVLALLPATGRWVGRIRRPRIGQPGVTGTTETGAILWPGT